VPTASRPCCSRSITAPQPVAASSSASGSASPSAAAARARLCCSLWAGRCLSRSGSALSAGRCSRWRRHATRRLSPWSTAGSGCRCFRVAMRPISLHCACTRLLRTSLGFVAMPWSTAFRHLTQSGWQLAARTAGWWPRSLASCGKAMAPMFLTVWWRRALRSSPKPSLSTTPPTLRRRSATLRPAALRRAPAACRPRLLRQWGSSAAERRAGSGSRVPGAFVPHPRLPS